MKDHWTLYTVLISRTWRTQSQCLAVSLFKMVERSMLDRYVLERRTSGSNHYVIVTTMNIDEKGVLDGRDAFNIITFVHKENNANYHPRRSLCDQGIHEWSRTCYLREQMARIGYNKLTESALRYGEGPYR